MFQNTDYAVTKIVSSILASIASIVCAVMFFNMYLVTLAVLATSWLCTIAYQLWMHYHSSMIILACQDLCKSCRQILGVDVNLRHAGLHALEREVKDTPYPKRFGITLKAWWITVAEDTIGLSQALVLEQLKAKDLNGFIAEIERLSSAARRVQRNPISLKGWLHALEDHSRLNHDLAAFEAKFKLPVVNQFQVA